MVKSRRRPRPWTALAVLRSMAVISSLAALALAGCATTAAGTAGRPDADVAADVRSRLATVPEINPFTVEVGVRDGVVTLSGHVESAETRIQAEKLAREVAGVVRIVNLLEVGSP